jgi:hypothetical protein
MANCVLGGQMIEIAVFRPTAKIGVQYKTIVSCGYLFFGKPMCPFDLQRELNRQSGVSTKANPGRTV